MVMKVKPSDHSGAVLPLPDTHKGPADPQNVGLGKLIKEYKARFSQTNGLSVPPYHRDAPEVGRAREACDSELAKSLPEAAEQVISHLCEAVLKNPTDPNLLAAFFDASKKNPTNPQLMETMQDLMGVLRHAT